MATENKDDGPNRFGLFDEDEDEEDNTKDSEQQYGRGHGTTEELERLSVRVPKRYKEAIEEMDEDGVFVNQSEVVRKGIRMVLKEEGYF